MNPLKLIIRNLRFYWKRNLLLSLGFAISAAVLTGALIVGDSVKYSLNRIVEQRLGEVTLIMQAGDRFFTDELTSNISESLNKPVSGVLMVDGVAVADGGQKRVNQIRVLGTDDSFDALGGILDFYSELEGDSVIISQNLAQRLTIEAGEEFILRMTKASLVPLNAPFVSEEENIISLRVTVKAIASTKELGAFNIQNSQTAPFNVFISAAKLQDLMEIGERSNLLLVADEKTSVSQLTSLVKEHWSTEDAGLKIRYDTKLKLIDVKSDRVFIDDAVANALVDANPSASPTLTYFVNTFKRDGSSTPYSFVSTLPSDELKNDEIVINKWLADDLKARVGDSVWLSYFVVGPLRELTVDSASYVVKNIVTLSGVYADRHLMPDIPGMSDAGNCRDWEAGIPISLESIRDKDEDYWTRYKGTPKAYISIDEATRLWSNRFGTYTSFRYALIDEQQEALSAKIMNGMNPEALGFEFRPVYNQASFAAENGVDFSELFGGLSFFLLAGAILLSVLLFKLNLEERKEQIKTLVSLGIPFRRIRFIMVTESIMVARFGGLLGLGLALLYTKGIFGALNSIWMDIVRTTMLEVDIRIITLLIGYLISMLIAWLVLYITLNKYLKRLVSKHIKREARKNNFSSYRVFSFLGIGTGIIALLLIVLQLGRSEVVNSSVFFSAGGLLLLSGIALSYGYLVKLKARYSQSFSLNVLSLKNAVSNLTRSMSIIILLALGTFIVISTGSNRKDLFVDATEKTSGTGGFIYYAESTIPVLHNLNDDDLRYEYGFSDSYNFIQLRIAEGDDASCLNLNRITNPRIMGVNPANLKERFAFVTAMDILNEEDPWATLDLDLENDLIPAIADETVIKWGLGMTVGDTLLYKDALGNTLQLLLVGGTAPSIFQGSVLISEANFLKHFPASSGTEVFLVEGTLADTALIEEEVRMGMRDYGWTMDYSAARLTEFNSITNTYLSIFMILGALGLLLGTIGLSIILFRSIIERKSEIALLKSVGYGSRKVKGLIIREYLVLLILGTLIGGISSVIATLPAYISKNSEISIVLVLGIIGILLVNGFFWIYWMTTLVIKNKSLSVALRNE